MLLIPKVSILSEQIYFCINRLYRVNCKQWCEYKIVVNIVKIFKYRRLVN